MNSCLRNSLLLLLAVLLAVSSADARKRRDYPVFEWGFRVAATGLYNSNLLRFSEADVDRFKTFDPRFATPVETIDEFETEYSLRPSIRWRAPMNMMVDGYYSVKTVFRTKNPLTDYQTHTLSASVRPRVRGYRWSLTYRVFRMPSYYLRVYRDRDFNEYHAARFSNWDHDVELSYRVNDRLWLDLSGAVGTYYYNSKFTEYDSEYADGGIGARLYLGGGLSLSGSYTRRISDNVGKDQPFSPIPEAADSPIEEDSEYGDADFNEDEFALRVRRPLSFIEFATTDASLSYRHRRRVYTTDRSLQADPFHRGRLDNRFEISPQIGVSLTSVFDISLYYLHEERTTESDNASVIQAKEFVRREAGLTLTYTLH